MEETLKMMTSSSLIPIFRLTNFKVLLRHFKNVVNIEPYFYFQKNTTDLKCILKQIKAIAKKTIDKLNFNQNYPKQKNGVNNAIVGEFQLSKRFLNSEKIIN